LVRSCAI
jgi:hypothetical protein